MPALRIGKVIPSNTHCGKISAAADNHCHACAPPPCSAGNTDSCEKAV
jgi:hypothetical protein